MAKLIKKSKAEVSPEVIKLSRDEVRAAAVVRKSLSKVDSIKQDVTKEFQSAASLFVIAAEAIATVAVERRELVLIEAGVDKTSSYFSSVKRAAIDLKETKRLLAETGNINRTLALLPAAKTETGATKGRKKKSESQRNDEMADKAIRFLLAHWEVNDIVSMVKAAAKAKRDAENTDTKEVEEDEVETV